MSVTKEGPPAGLESSLDLILDPVIPPILTSQMSIYVQRQGDELLTSWNPLHTFEEEFGSKTSDILPLLYHTLSIPTDS